MLTNGRILPRSPPWPARITLESPSTLKVILDSGLMRLRLRTDRLLHRCDGSTRQRLALPSGGHALLDIEKGVFEALWREIVELGFEKEVAERLKARARPARDPVMIAEPSGPWIDILRLLFVLVRAYRPQVVLETGVGPVGATSAFILKALDLNHEGHLFSVDANRYGVAYGVDVGQGILDELRGRHTLVVADSSVLGRLTEQLPPIDFFLHDSDHSYANMMREFSVAWAKLQSGGFLISDDCNNDAFDRFAASLGLRPAFVNYGGTDFGVLMRPRFVASVVPHSTKKPSEPKFDKSTRPTA